MIGRVAVTAAVRAWPFRVFSFPAQVITPQTLKHGVATLQRAIAGQEDVEYDKHIDIIDLKYWNKTLYEQNDAFHNWMTVTKVDHSRGVITLRPTHELLPSPSLGYRI